MKGESVIYLGRAVSKEGFRVFVYSTSGETKLVESWDEFLDAMASGLWFPTKNNVPMVSSTPDDVPSTSDLTTDIGNRPKRGRRKK